MYNRTQLGPGCCTGQPSEVLKSFPHTVFTAANSDAPTPCFEVGAGSTPLTQGGRLPAAILLILFLLDGREDAAGYANLFSLDLSMNRLSTLDSITPLLYLPALRSLCLQENPICLLHDYRRKVASSIPTLENLDGSPVLENERVPSLALKRERLPWEDHTPPPSPPPPRAGGEEEEQPPIEQAPPPPAEQKEGEPDPNPPVPLDTNSEIELGFVITRLSGLSDPNDEPEAPPPPAEDEPLKEEEEEETEEMRVFNFYTENPPRERPILAQKSHASGFVCVPRISVNDDEPFAHPEFFATLAIPGQPPLQTNRVTWGDEGREGGDIPLSLRRVKDAQQRHRSHAKIHQDTMESRH